MGLKETVTRLVGGESETDRRADAEPEGSPGPDEEPSHVCQSCGEAYYTDPEMEIGTCRECGGVKVEPVGKPTG